MLMQDNLKQQIRCLVSNIYDLQKLRISAGNRLVQSFYLKLGTTPSEDDTKVIALIKNEFGRVADAVSQGVSIKKAISKLNVDTEENKALEFIKDEMDYKLINSYILLLKSEEESIKTLDNYVKKHPLWDNFFAEIKGCGTLMSAVCIAYFDIYKARYVSSFYRYAGLDTVQDKDKEGNALFIAKNNPNKKLRHKSVFYYECDGSEYKGNIIRTGEVTASGEELLLTNTGEIIIEEPKMKNGEFVYEDIETGEEYIGEVLISQHGRRKGDTEMFEYTDSEGNKAMKRGITYNPIVKTKLMGVLTGCLLKAKDPVYSAIYYDYRARLDNSAEHRDKTAGHKNMMAQRYMIKQFLRNLWTSWRTIEGLEVNYPYEVAKLGNKPHKYNQYQCEQADKYYGVS